MVAISPETHGITHTALPVSDRAGSSTCFNCLIETFQTQAYNLARSMLSDWSLAEDAVQESFVSAYRAFRNFRGDNLNAWLMRIVANTCRDMLRARRSRPSVPLDPVSGNPDDPDSTLSAVDLPSDTESPEDFAERRELSRAIQAGLETLPEEQRMAIVLVDVQGYSYEEASSVMACSLGTVKSRISRGRSGLREYLRQTGELLPSQFRHDG